MAKTLEKIAFAVLVMFGLVGAFLMGIILHEYSHLSDYRGVAETEQICALAIPDKLSGFVTGEAGYFSFKYENTDENIAKVSDVQKYTEIKAYSLTFLVLMIFVICTAIAATGNKNRKQISLSNSTGKKINYVLIDKPSFLSACARQ